MTMHLSIEALASTAGHQGDVRALRSGGVLTLWEAEIGGAASDVSAGVFRASNWATSKVVWRKQAFAKGDTGATGATGAKGDAGSPGFAPSAADPVSPTEGQIWFNTVEHTFRGFAAGVFVTFTMVADE